MEPERLFTESRSPGRYPKSAYSEWLGEVAHTWYSLALDPSSLLSKYKFLQFPLALERLYSHGATEHNIAISKIPDLRCCTCTVCCILTQRTSTVVFSWHWAQANTHLSASQCSFCTQAGTGTAGSCIFTCSSPTRMGKNKLSMSAPPPNHSLPDAMKPFVTWQWWNGHRKTEIWQLCTSDLPSAHILASFPQRGEFKEKTFPSFSNSCSEKGRIDLM